MGNRKRITPTLKQQLLMEAGYRCGNPRCPTILAIHLLEDHHIKYVSEGGGNDLSNLLALCPNCHTLHHHGDISQEAIRHWKGMLLALNNAFDRQVMDLLLFLYRTRNETITYAGDGVLRFARLIGAGLVAIKETFRRGNRIESGGETKISYLETSHLIELTQRGELLVEAWIAGDEKKYRDLIEQGSS